MELLIAISIVGILSVIGLNIFKEATKTARDNIRKQDLKKLSLALEVYLQKNTFYIKGIGSCKADTVTFYDATLGIAPTMAGGGVPTDPSSHAQYCYIGSSAGDAWRLFTKLEKPNTSDPNFVDCPDYNWTVFSDNLKPTCPTIAH